MRISLKLFLAIFSISLVGLVGLEVGIYRLMVSRFEAEYAARYRDFANQVGDTLVQVERLSDLALWNAAHVLREVERAQGLPTNSKLMSLKETLGVRSLSIADDRGRFLRSDFPVLLESDPALKAHYKGKNPLATPLFTYCKDYKDLVTGRSSLAKTPFIPSGSGGFPAKYLMIPNHNGTRILEANMLMGSLEEILHKAMGPDSNLASVTLFTPSGALLGRVPSGGGKPLSSTEISQIDFSKPTATDSEFVFFTRVPTSAPDCCECRTKRLTLDDGAYYYTLRTEVSRAALLREISRVRRWFLGVGLLAMCLSAITAHFVSRYLVRRLEWMSERVAAIAETDDLSLRLGMPGRDEISSLGRRFDAMVAQLEIGRAQAAAAEREKALVEVARQVAHDVRSPLAALESLVKDLSKIPESQRSIMRSAVGRVRDIADDLLERHRVGRGSLPAEAVTRPSALPDDAPSPCRLSTLIEPIIAEKRLQYRHRPGLSISFLDGPATGVFARVHPQEFQRVISNLINNSVEAIEAPTGSVSVTTSEEGDAVVVRVEDDGKGIPPELLHRIGKSGESHGKEGGSGLGLSHAIKRAEGWGGRVEITPGARRGTIVSLYLPRAPSGRESAREFWDAVLIDDDPLVRKSWEIHAARIGKRLLALSTVAKFLELAASVDLRTPIYIDVDLGGGVDGVGESLRVHRLGFQEIHLATGHERSSFSGLSHLRSVVGKEPPWLA